MLLQNELLARCGKNSNMQLQQMTTAFNCTTLTNVSSNGGRKLVGLIGAYVTSFFVSAFDTDRSANHQVNDTVASRMIVDTMVVI